MRFGVAAGLIVGTWSAVAQAQLAPSAPDGLALGDWKLTPVLEARVRGEYRYDLDANHRGFLVERARLGLDVERSAVEARVVLQDVRVWDLGAGDDKPWEPGALAQTSAFEAWGEVHSAGLRPALLRVGRQPITWGEGRLLGVADWAPRARSLDAVRGILPVGDGSFELLAANLADSSGGLASVGELFGARGEWTYHPLFAVEAYVLARLAHLPNNYPSVRGQTYTGALRLHGEGQAWTWGVEGAYQLGRADDINLGEDRAAWAAAAHVAHAFERAVGQPSLQVGASYATGDDGSATYHAFDQILPDVHVWHGAMDLFGWSNEEEVNARAAISPWSDAVASVAYRYARLVEPGGAWRSDYLVEIGRAPGNTRADLGHEIDAVLTWSPWVEAELTAGYSMLVTGAGARAIIAANISGATPPSLSHYAYLQGTLRVP